MTSPTTACSPHLVTSAEATFYFIPVHKSTESLTHLYYVVHRERYGMHEMIEQGIIKNPSPNCSLKFEKEWLEKHGKWSLTIQGFQQQVSCFKITTIIENYLNKQKSG